MADVLVDLTPSECQVACMVAESRRKWHLQNHSTSTQFWNQDAISVDNQSVGAELAVSKYLNVYPPVAVISEAPKFDLVFSGASCDVKSVMKRPYKTHLLIPYLNPDLFYISVVNDMPHFFIRGFIQGRNVEAVGEWVNLGKHTCWRIEPCLLTHISLLAQHTKGVLI